MNSNNSVNYDGNFIQESRAVAGKQHDASVNFDPYVSNTINK